MIWKCGHQLEVWLPPESVQPPKSVPTNEKCDYHLKVWLTPESGTITWKYDFHLKVWLSPESVSWLPSESVIIT